MKKNFQLFPLDHNGPRTPIVFRTPDRERPESGRILPGNTDPDPRVPEVPAGTEPTCQISGNRWPGLWAGNAAFWPDPLTGFPDIFDPEAGCSNECSHPDDENYHCDTYEGSPPQGLSGASNPEGIRREKNHQVLQATAGPRAGSEKVLLKAAAGAPPRGRRQLS
jgi:hypothetical protein